MTLLFVLSVVSFALALAQVADSEFFNLSPNNVTIATLVSVYAFSVICFVKGLSAGGYALFAVGLTETWYRGRLLLAIHRARKMSLTNKPISSSKDRAGE